MKSTNQITNEIKLIEISVVIPLYNCSNTIEILVERLIKVFEEINLNAEIILVNDFSPQNDWEIVSRLALKNNLIKGINLSRNFGQHPAIFCGLNYTNGNWIVVMDGDLQDKPEEIIKLYNKAKEGYDIVFAKRKDRKDNLVKKAGSYFFYKLLNYLSNSNLNHQVGNFGIYHSNVIKAVLSMGDEVKFFYSMVNWVGFNSDYVEVEHDKRGEGKSSYSFKKLFSLAFQGIISFSNKPLKIMIKLGFTIVLISVLMILYYLYKYFNGEIVVLGYASLIISIWFLSGCMISMIGIVGLYLGKVFDKVKSRPAYLIKEIVNN